MNFTQRTDVKLVTFFLTFSSIIKGILTFIWKTIKAICSANECKNTKNAKYYENIPLNRLIAASCRCSNTFQDDSDDPEVKETLKLLQSIPEYELTKADFKHQCKNARNGYPDDCFRGTSIAECSYYQKYWELCNTCNKMMCENARHGYYATYMGHAVCTYAKVHQKQCDYCS